VPRGTPSIPAILDAGVELLAERPPGQVSMAAVAAAAGYSRMAVYRHFGSRAGLLTALLAHIDETEGAEASVREVLTAPNPKATIEQLFTWWAGYIPRFAGVARGVLAAKAADADLQAAWDDRMGDLRRVCDAVTARCHATPAFADTLWALMSVPLWLQLADDGWTRTRCARTMADLALGALTPPAP
jgi:AcrR family transcriptional regulator